MNAGNTIANLNFTGWTRIVGLHWNTSDE